MIIQGLLCAVVMFLVQITEWGWGNLTPRPIWICPLVGLVLGDLKTGIIIGGMIEAVFMGTFSVGGSVPSDIASASIFGAAFGILSGANIENAVALSVPIGLLATLLFHLVVLCFNFVLDAQDRAIKNHQDKKFSALHWFAFFFKPAVYSIMTFVAIAAGSGAIQDFMAALPEQVNNILGVMASSIPALGMAILIKNMWDVKIIPYYFAGFIVAAYLGVSTFVTAIDPEVATNSIGFDTMSLAIIGAVLGVVVIFNDIQNNKKQASIKTTTNDESEEFF